MKLSSSQIIQADATLIAGLLILLSISFAISESSPETSPYEDPKRNLFFMAIPLCISGTMAAIGSTFSEDSKNYKTFHIFAIGGLATGFVYVGLVLSSIFFLT